MVSGPIIACKIDRDKMETNGGYYLLLLKNPLDSDCSHEIFFHWKNSYDKPRQCIKKQRQHFVDNGLYSQTMVFPVGG